MRRPPAARRLRLALALDVLAIAAVGMSLAVAPQEQTTRLVAAPTIVPTAAPTTRPSPTEVPRAEPTVAVPRATTTPPPPLRDVYYIVIEEYANREILAKHYDFDNSPFLDALRERGFVIPSRVRGPYPKTPHSVSATVNMNYLSFPRTSKDWHLVNDSLQHSKVAQEFQRLGYTYVLLGSGYYALRRDETADVNPVYQPTEKLDERHRRYEEVRFMYRRALEIVRDPAPTFTFLHIETTHSPYVFKRDGSFLDEPTYEADPTAASLESLRYANTKSLELIDAIKASAPADRQPIVVFQADEGPGPDGWDPRTRAHYDWTRADQRTLDIKFGIFSSYYLPGLKDTGVVPDMSTVNSFRLVFNKYFGTGYRMLLNRSYVFPDELSPYDFIDVTEKVK